MAHVDYDLKVEKLWEEFANVTLREDEEEEGIFKDLVLSCSWHVFEEGTSREYIWHWFDEEHSKGVAYLLHDYVYSYERTKS